jgi:imidazole glycerol-phosphate synthase subunit HisF
VNDRKRVYYRTELKNRRRDLRKKSTDTEKILWEQLRNSKLGVKFRRQYSVTGYVIDFYCPEKRLGIELEGGVHKRKNQIIYDKYREEYIKAFGIKLIKFRNEEVEKDINKIFADIKNHLTL